MKFLTNIDLTKNELQNAVIQNLPSDPASPKPGQIYFHNVNKVFYGYNGTSWIDLGQVLTGSAIVTLINACASTIDDDNLSANAIDAISKRHSHSNKAILDAIEVAFTTAMNTKLSGISAGANKTETSSTNGNIKIDGVEKTVYTHPAGTNPHGTTKSDVGLGNVDNKSSATIRSEITSSNVTTALGFTPIKNGGTIPSIIDGNGVSRPTAIGSGNIYISTDNGGMYKDVGSGVWRPLAGTDLSLADENTDGLLSRYDYEVIRDFDNLYNYAQYTLPSSSSWFQIASIDSADKYPSGRFELSWIDTYDSHTPNGFAVFQIEGTKIIQLGYTGDNSITKARIIEDSQAGYRLEIFKVYTNAATDPFPLRISQYTDVLNGKWSLNYIATYAPEQSNELGETLTFSSGLVTNNCIMSQVATGNAPFVVSSTTKVNNLNADLLDEMHATNTNTPSTVVSRDASGNFSAGTISANLSGNASTATTATNLAGGSAGTIPYQTGAGATSQLSAGSAGQVLKSNGTSAPSWQTLDLTYLPDAAYKKSVKVATTANITLSGTQTIDGIAVVSGDRVLVKDQTTASQNGIYIVSATAWSRAADADSISEIAGATVNVDSGATNGGFIFSNNLKTTDTLNTTAMPWYKVISTFDAASANTANKVVQRDGSGNFSAGTITATGFSGPLTGNASTATKLQTARTINGVSFDGSANITIADSTKEPTITAGTAAQYWRGDKTWQTLSLANIADDATHRTITDTERTNWNTNSFYTNSSAMQQTIGGLAAGTTFNNMSVNDLLTNLLYPYTAPLITLSATPGSTLKEFGDPIASISFTATTTKKSKPITSVVFYKDATTINTVASPNASGGTESYTYSTATNATCTYTAKVSDGTQTVTSNGITYTFTYPTYVGTVTNQTVTETDVKAITKLVRTKANLTQSFTTTSSRFCFAYPASFGNLISILDPNQFEILGDFTVTTMNMTMLDSSSVSYKVYVFNNIVSVSAFNVTFKY